MRSWITHHFGTRIMRWLYPSSSGRPTFEYVSSSTKASHDPFGE
jgi:hypothetical protein